MLEITKNKLLLNQSFKQNTYSFSVDGDVIVPDSKPDVENILFIDCVPSIEEESVNSGQITITGSCEFNIIYASEESDSQVVRISTSMPFKNSFEVPGINSESKFRVNIMVSDINSSILNGRKINLESAFPVKITSFMNSEIDFIENLTPDDTTQVLSEDKNVAEIMSLTKENTTVSDTSIIPMSLPNIKDIIKYDTRATNDEYTISDGKVIFKGDLFIRIYYMSDNDNKIYSFDISLPFSGFSNMKNINDNNSININSMVNTLSLKILPDSDELMRVVEFSAYISTNIFVMGNRDIPLITDLYSTETALNPNIETINYHTFSPQLNEDILLRGSINIPENENISTLATLGRVKQATLEQKDDKTILKGILEVIVLYQIISSNKINSVSIDMPVEHILDFVINDIINISVTNTDSLQSEMNKFDIKINLEITGENIKTEEIKVLTDIIESDNINKINSGITIYYTKNDDTYWKIAKKFNTTIDKILKTNSMNASDNLPTGKTIVI